MSGHVHTIVRRIVLLIFNSDSRRKIAPGQRPIEFENRTSNVSPPPPAAPPTPRQHPPAVMASVVHHGARKVWDKVTDVIDVIITEKI